MVRLRCSTDIAEVAMGGPLSAKIRWGRKDAHLPDGPTVSLAAGGNEPVTLENIIWRGLAGDSYRLR